MTEVDVTQADREAAQVALESQGGRPAEQRTDLCQEWIATGEYVGPLGGRGAPLDWVARAIADTRAASSAEVTRLAAEVERLKVLAASSITLSIRAGDDEPWSLRECVIKLVEAADILLHQKDYDGAHWELIQSAWTHAKGYLDAPAVASELEADIKCLRDACHWWYGNPTSDYGPEWRAIARIEAALGLVKR